MHYNGKSRHIYCHDYLSHIYWHDKLQDIYWHVKLPNSHLLTYTDKSSQ